MAVHFSPSKEHTHSELKSANRNLYLLIHSDCMSLTVLHTSDAVYTILCTDMDTARAVKLSWPIPKMEYLISGLTS